ncbi:MAG: hypothetical protein MUD08_01705 [Cytophagales bacterium]|nr:hypothetical protein [Cytophagales bacterium]
MNLFFRMAFTLALIGFLASCKKSDEVQPATDADFANAEASLEVLSEVQSLNNVWVAGFADDAADRNEPRKAKAARVAAVREEIESDECGLSSFFGDEASSTFGWTVDYGTGTNCDGVVKKGKIKITVSGGEQTGAIVINFIGYEEGSRKLSGDFAWAANASETSFSFTYKATKLVYTDEEGTLSWDSDYTLSSSLKEGRTQLTGRVSGTDRAGKNFSASITAPLVYVSSCEHQLVSGKYLVEAQGHPSAEFDFGDGSCDDSYSVTIRGTSRTLQYDESVSLALN